MRNRHGVRLGVLGVILSVALVGAGCTNPSPSGGIKAILEAQTLTSIDQNEFGGPNFWDNDDNDEPFLVHLALRIQLNGAQELHSTATSTYANGGAYFCDIKVGQTCDGPPGDGAFFGGIFRPDLVELNNGEKLELLGSVEIMYERDVLLPLGLVEFWQGVAGLITAALPTILAEGGALPTDAQGIVNFLQAVLPPALTAVLGLVGTNLGGLIGGDSDDLVGVAPLFYLAVGGSLAGIISAVLPTVIQLVNQLLATQPDSPFPNGLPIQIGVIGQGALAHFDSTGTTAPLTKYDVTYNWVEV
jgi:hypothetical protein